VVSAFSLDTPTSKRAIRDKVEQLLDEARYIYKDTEQKTGIFLAPVIQTLINKTWFRGKKDDGVIHPEFFEDEMLSLSTLALVLTVIENNLDEWVTGEHVAVAFSQNAYKQKYLAHVRRLKDFDEKTRESNIVPRLRKHLLKMARKHAKVDATGVKSKPAELSQEDIEAAKKEWENIVLSEGEDEM